MQCAEQRRALTIKTFSACLDSTTALSKQAATSDKSYTGTMDRKAFVPGKAIPLLERINILVLSHDVLLLPPERLNRIFLRLIVRLNAPTFT